MNVEKLNVAYKSLSPIKRLERIFDEVDNNKILVTSSFGVTSGILLGMVANVAPGFPIHFIDTRFCFSKTLEYKQTLIESLSLNVIDVTPRLEDNSLTTHENMWTSNPDQCCYLNKVKPLDLIKRNKDLWISGLLMNSAPFRKNLNIFENRSGILKMHPNIDTTAEAFSDFLVQNNILPHPLSDKGFSSIGCTHCTVRGSEREGRWKGNDKTECGLHL